MAKREILALNESTPQIEAAQSGDTYLLPRLCFTTTGEFESEVTAGASANAFTFNTGSNYRGTAGAKMFVIENNGTEEMSVTGNTTATTTTIRGRQDNNNKLLIQAGARTTSGTMTLHDFFGLNISTVLDIQNPFIFNALSVDDSGGAKTALGFNATTALTNNASIIASFAHGTGVEFVKIFKQGGIQATYGLGLHGNAVPAQHSSTGDVTGFAAGSGTASKSDSEWDGDSGSTGYTVGDIVSALKDIGILAA